MTTIAGQLNSFNNLLYNTKRISLADKLEHRAGRVPLDLSYKTPARTNEIINCDAAQINGKHGDLKYKPKGVHSRPYYGYDARFDPTILNAVRYKYTDVSGRLIAPVNLPKKYDMNRTYKPLKPYGIVQ
jgi:hypothetical protein